MTGAPTKLSAVTTWVDDMAALCQPDQVYWCDGSAAEKERLLEEALAAGEFEALNPTLWPGCYLHRSIPMTLRVPKS